VPNEVVVQRSTALAAVSWRPQGPASPAKAPWLFGSLVAIVLAAAYLIASPPAADLAAATYRSSLFARAGFTTWDNGWYAAHGHWLPAYSLLAPALGALLGVRVLLALSALAASVLFGLIADRCFGRTAGRVAAGVFALGIGVGTLSGRVPFELGVAIGLGSVLAFTSKRFVLALALAALTSLSSPVAGAFLALAGLAAAIGGAVTGERPGADRDAVTGERPGADRDAVTDGRPMADGEASARVWRGVALALVSLAPALTLSIAFPEGGYEPFAASAFWPALGGVLPIAALLPSGPLSASAHRAVRAGAALYAIGLVAAFVVHTPMGGNAARLGPLLAAPLLVGVMWERRRAALLALAPILLYWQLATPIRDVTQIWDDPSVHAAYYAPLRAELRRLGTRSTIVEVPLTKAHWEATHLAGHDGVALARGWERQLDTRYAALFYRPRLSPGEYERWLAENRVAYVALPDVPLDRAGRAEGALVASGLPYLREIWGSSHWRLYAFIG
jgi:hypothetical protein